MDLSNFDWSKHDDGDGPGGLIPPGDFLLGIKGFKRVQRGRDQHLDLRLTPLVCVRSKEMESGQEIGSGVIYETVVLAERGIWKLAEIFKAINAPTTVNLESDRDLARSIKGRVFLASVYQDEYNGKTRNKMDHALVMTDEGRSFLEAAQGLMESSSSSSSGGGGYGDPGDPGDSGGGGSYRGGSSDYSDDDIPF